MQKTKEILNNNKEILLVALVFTGIILRFWVMSFGHNFDFESFCIVGDLANQHKNIYENTPRYNYGPLFFCIQGLCFRLAGHISQDPTLTYRILIVAVVTMGDIGIMLYLYTRHSLKIAALFFLNPISIIITGYHNQFDNLIVFIMLLSIAFFNEDEKFNKKDIGFICSFAIGLMLKHIFFLFPAWLLLKKGLPVKKKLLYSILPPVIFLLSFIPFIVGNPKAFEGVKNNVFLYRSINNAPLLKHVYNLLSIPDNMRFICFAILLCIMGYILRTKKFEYQVLMYLLCLVSFSSAIANQYLAIPIVALCVLSGGICISLYYFLIGLYLLLQSDGLGLIAFVHYRFPNTIIENISNFICSQAYFIAAIILFLVILNEVLPYKTRVKILKYI